MSTNENEEQSCIAKSGLRLIANLEFDFSLENERYSFEYSHVAHMVKIKTFKVVSTEGTHPGYIIFNDIFAVPYKTVGIYVNNVEEVIMKYDFQINGIEFKGLLNGMHMEAFDDKPLGNHFNVNGIKYFFKTFKGKLEIMMKPKYSITEFKPHLLNKLLAMPELSSKIKIICQGKSFQINRMLISSMSEVFEKMFENSYSKEASTGTVMINDVSPHTINAFKETISTLLSENTIELNTNHFNAPLLMFAHKYAIAFLEKIISNYFQTSLNMENIYEIMEAACLTNNNDLLDATLNFVKGNPKTFNKENENWMKFQGKYPNCFV